MKKTVNSEQLPDQVRQFVIYNKSDGYLCGSTRGHQYWSHNLNDARKWNRRSDATNSQNRSISLMVRESKVLAVTFTHGFQAIY